MKSLHSFLATIFFSFAPVIAYSATSVSRDVLAESSEWQSLGVVLQPGFVAEIKVSGTWHINPTWHRDFGAGGNPGETADSLFMKPGANEGCLLVKVGSKVSAFSKDDETLKVTGQGPITFLANDEPTKKAYYEINGEDSGAGFLDNEGSLKVTVTMRSEEPSLVESTLASSTETDFLRAREKRDKALATVTAPINELYRTTLKELLRRAKDSDDQGSAAKIQFELQMLDSGGRAQIADLPTLRRPRLTEPDLTKQLTETKWRLSADKTFVLHADGTSTSNWTPRRGFWRVVDPTTVELSIMNVPRTERARVEQDGAFLIWLNKEADEEQTQVARKIEAAN